MYISRDVRLSFKKIIAFFCLKICFTFTNSVDPDEMHHYAAFHLGLHCLQKYSCRGFPRTDKNVLGLCPTEALQVEHLEILCVKWHKNAALVELDVLRDHILDF